MLAANVTAEPARAMRFASAARSDPSMSTTMPARIGSQITMLKIGRSTALAPHHEPTDQGRKAENHGERVMIEITRLHAPHDAREHGHGLGTAVDDEAVDEHAIAGLPEQPADDARRRA